MNRCRSPSDKLVLSREAREDRTRVDAGRGAVWTGPQLDKITGDEVQRGEASAEAGGGSLHQWRCPMRASARRMRGRLRAAEQRRVGTLDQGVRNLDEEEAGMAVLSGRGVGVAQTKERQRGVGKDSGAIVEPTVGEAVEGGHTLFIYSAHENIIWDAVREAERQLRSALDEAARRGEQIGSGEPSAGEGTEERDIALAVHVPLHVGEAGGGIGGIVHGGKVSTRL